MTAGLPQFMPMAYGKSLALPIGRTRLLRMFPREKFRIRGEARYLKQNNSIYASRLVFERNHHSWATMDFCQFAEVTVLKKHFAFAKKNQKLLFWAAKVPVTVKPHDRRDEPGDCVEEPSLLCVHWPGSKNDSVFEICVADVETVGTKLRREYGNSVGIVEKINTRVDKFLAEQLDAGLGGASLVGSANTDEFTGMKKEVDIKDEPTCRRSERSTKGERISSRLEDEVSPERPQRTPKPQPKQSNNELMRLNVKVAQLEGEAARFKAHETELIRQWGCNSTNALTWRLKCQAVRKELSNLKVKYATVKLELKAVKAAPSTEIQLNTPELEGKLLL